MLLRFCARTGATELKESTSTSPGVNDSSFDGVKTKCGGTISPSVRVSFAIRLRRVSATDGNAGEVGVTVGVVDVDDVPVVGVRRVLGVDGAGEVGAHECPGVRGTALSRSTSGRGSSLERDLGLCSSGVDGFILSESERGGRRASDAVGPGHEYGSTCGYFWDVGACRRDAFSESGVEQRLLDGEDERDGPMGRSVMGMGSSKQATRGVVPRTVLSFLAERTRRVRSHLFSALEGCRGAGRRLGCA